MTSRPFTLRFSIARLVGSGIAAAALITGATLACEKSDAVLRQDSIGSTLSADVTGDVDDAQHEATYLPFPAGLPDPAPSEFAQDEPAALSQYVEVPFEVNFPVDYPTVVAGYADPG
jgi:hypothetical protein